MTPQEEGFLLLTSHLGNPERKVLSTSQLRTLAMRIQQADTPREIRDLTASDIVRLGYCRDDAERIIGLLEEKELLQHYLGQGTKYDCYPITRAGEQYPQLLRSRLGLDSPGCIWTKGDTSILNTPMVALVGSRDLRNENRAFAREVGYQAAVQGMTLVSGNARGADREAQESCLRAGGRVISIVADTLWHHPLQHNMLYMSENEYDEPFSALRALSRNRCIHALGWIVFVAQATLHQGGTWDGTVKNLRFGWSPVACFQDGSDSTAELTQLGAFAITMQDLSDFRSFSALQTSLF